MSLPPEVSFAQRLASNQPHIREKALRKLGVWFKKISESDDDLEEDRMMRLWKGLFYYFWLCDKPLAQEDRADVMSKYIHMFQTPESAFLYLDTFFQTMAIEWNGIDRWRYEKFLMLVRRYLHQSYQLLKNLKWEEKYMNLFFDTLRKTVLNPSADSAPFSLKCHISDIFMEELAKAASEEITPELLEKFLVPFCTILCKSDDSALTSSVKKDVFLYLINQDDDDTNDDDTDEDDEEKADKFPVLKFDANSIQKLLLQYSKDSNMKRKNLKLIHSIIKEFEDYKNGISLGDKLFPEPCAKRKIRKRAIEKASLALIEEDKDYMEKKKSFKRKKMEQQSLDEIESDGE